MKERIRGLLLELGPATASQIAKWLKVEPHNAARMADSLTERGDLRRDLVDEGRHSYYLYAASPSTGPERTRLCISRRVGQSIVLQLPDGKEVTCYVSEIKPGQVRVGVVAPQEVRILRDELLMGLR